MTRRLFYATARALRLTFRGNDIDLAPRAFRSGSLGWRHQGEIVEVINGVPHKVLYVIQATVRGSKGWPNG